MKSFSLESFSEFKTRWFLEIKKEIENKSKEYILGINQDEFVSYLFNKYKLEPLAILYETERISEPIKSKTTIEDRFNGRREIDVYDFKITYNFTGTPVLFRVRPSRWLMTSYEIDINSSLNEVSFNLKQNYLKVDDFKNAKKDCLDRAFGNIINVNSEIIQINMQLDTTIIGYLNSVKSKYLTENDFFEAIKIKVNEGAKTIFTTPSVREKIIPQPVIQKNKEFASEPTLDSKVYNDILTVMYEVGKSMEKKPNLYIGKDEESIRDQFLLFLETRYEGVTATGETFNRSGKTDILLKYSKDGTNIFIAECKYWHGVSQYHDAISQLFDNYLTWRDTKTAVVLFVKNKDFSNVLDTIKSNTLKHPYANRKINERGESSFSYEFHLPQDKDKKVFLEIMAFHFDKE